MTTDANIHLQGAVLHVDSLDRAIDFYTALLDLRVGRRTWDAAVLVSPGRDSSLALRERPAQHFTDRTVMALVWRVSTPKSLGHVEDRLRSLSPKPVKRTVNEEGFTLVSGHDPDGQRLIFIHHDGAADVPSDIPTEVFSY